MLTQVGRRLSWLFPTLCDAAIEVGTRSGETSFHGPTDPRPALVPVPLSAESAHRPGGRFHLSKRLDLAIATATERSPV